MFLEQLQAVWNEYYPIVLAGISAVAVFAGGIYAVYKTISPVLDKLKELKTKVDSDKDESTILESIKIDTMKTDLLRKLKSPVIDDQIKAQYQTQLDKLNQLTTFGSESLAKVEDITNKYS